VESPDSPGRRLLQAMAMAQEMADTAGWDAPDVTRVVLGALPREQVVVLRAAAELIVAAADEVLAEDP